MKTMLSILAFAFITSPVFSAGGLSFGTATQTSYQGRHFEYDTEQLKQGAIYKVDENGRLTLSLQRYNCPLRNGLANAEPNNSDKLARNC